MTTLKVVPTQLVSFEQVIESKSSNPGKVAMEFSKAKLKASIATWRTNVQRLRYDPEGVREHKEWISEAEDQVRQLEDWLKNPLQLHEFIRQVRAYDYAYKTNLYGQIFDHAPILQ